MKKTAILGAGMAGIGAARLLNQKGVPVEVFEKCEYIGGHAYSFIHPDGWIFDEGPHISFTKNPHIQKLFASSVNNRYESENARVNNLWKEKWIKHPVQANLNGLPLDILVKVLDEMIRAQFQTTRPINDYADWLAASFGKAFAETFPTQYGLKFHTTHPSNMTTDWVGPRLYRPELAEILRGALTPDTDDVHYITSFRYPSHGGFAAFLKPLAKEVKVHLSHEATEIDMQNRQLIFRNGIHADFDNLISSLPLPELIRLINAVPEEVMKASNRLACTTCVVVNIGVDRSDLSEHHWTYFYDHDICFSRLSFPHMFSPHNVPRGTGSIQAEIYYSNKYKPLDRSPESCIDLVLDDLKRCGVLSNDDRILFRDIMFIPYANVIFDLDRPAALNAVHSYLADVGIETCGRYGEWSYAWSDESFVSGEEAALRLLNRR